MASKVANKPCPLPISQQSFADKEEEKKKKGLLKQLLKISQQPERGKVSSGFVSTSKQSEPPSAVAPRRPILKKQTSTTAGALAATVASAGNYTANFARAEHGRLSLRSVSTSGPPARASTQPIKPKLSAPPKPNSKDAEMSLWLRRKEYNPMKAAAEARTKKNVPTSSTTVDPPYLSKYSTVPVLVTG